VHEAQVDNILIANIRSHTAGNDIDVYLASLTENLKIMWKEDFEVFDTYHQKNFKLRAILLWTINDFPTYENLSGYNMKGHKTYHVCEEDTFSLQLKHGRKTIYLDFQIFFPRSHHYRRLRKAFNGSRLSLDMHTENTEFQNLRIKSVRCSMLSL